MAKKLAFICLVLILAACTKEELSPNSPQLYCTRVFDKVTHDLPGDTTTYWLWLERDTLCPGNPFPVPCIYAFKKQVFKEVYDTMLVPGQPYKPTYCY